MVLLDSDQTKLLHGPREEVTGTKSEKQGFYYEVMFLCVVARPRYDDYRKSYLDGKIGLWPFVERVPAKRNSRNRPAGTLKRSPSQ